MEVILLCPVCRVRVEKDDIGELVCPRCGVRVCPKAHIVEGKICTQCGWEDPNYYLWHKRQRAGSAGTSTGGWSVESKAGKSGKICPKCGVDVAPGERRCQNCGWLFPPSVGREEGVTTGTTSSGIPRVTFTGHYPSPSVHDSGQSVLSQRSPLLKESTISGVGGRRWDFDRARRFLQPVGAGLVVLGLCAGLVWGSIAAGKYIGSRLGTGDEASQITTVQTSPGVARTCLFSPSVVPPDGGKIHWSPEGSAFTPGTRITLSAEPKACYEFDYWDGIADVSPEVTIDFDPQKPITAYFKRKDTVAPGISEVRVTSYSDVGAVIRWRTDEPARGRVEYGVTTDYGQAVEESKLSTEHTVRLGGLSAGKTYYFRVTSLDECGNEAVAQEGKFTTLSFVAEGANVGERAPDFTLPSYKDGHPDSPNNPESPNYIGDQVSLSQFRGKWVFLNLWNTFCAACIGEFPHIQEFYKDEGWANWNSPDAEYVVLTVCIDGRVDRIAKLEEKYKYQVGLFTFPILVDDAEKRTLTNLYRVTYVPKSMLIDPDGIIRAVKTEQFKSEEEIKELFKGLE